MGKGLVKREAGANVLALQFSYSFFVCSAFLLVTLVFSQHNEQSTIIKVQRPVQSPPCWHCLAAGQARGGSASNYSSAIWNHIKLHNETGRQLL